MPWKVAPGKSILVSTGPAKSRQFMSGEIVPDQFIPDALEKFRNGFLIPARLSEEEAVLMAQQREDENAIPVPGASSNDKDHNARDVKDAPTTDSIEGARTESPTNPYQDSIWTVNPDDLDGLDLDELKVRILDIDEKVDTDQFETVDQAIAFLTRDFDPSDADDDNGTED